MSSPAYTALPLTRPNWTGANADVDIHLEEHMGFVDKAFAYSSKLASILNIRTIRGTNNLRVDRLGDVAVQGRKSGEQLVATKVHNDKFNLVVDTLLYTRHNFDHFDDWTASFDARKEVGEADGIALAKLFDQAALIQALKCADFVVPTGLEGSFNPGILEKVTITSAVSDGEANADALVRAHRRSIEQLINRDLGDEVLSEGVTFVTPAIFTVLMDHKRLTNVDFQGGSGVNDFARARIAVLNGVRLIETPRIPTAAISSHPLGSAFNVSPTEAKRQMITIIPSKTLIAGQVAPLTSRYWENEGEFCWVLDTYQAYNIGQRRPDTAAVVEVTVI
jgi:hypothetical protein